MAAPPSTADRPRPIGLVVGRRALPGATGAAVLLIVGAWIAAVALQATGHAAALHHHALIEGTPGDPAPPIWLAIVAFLVSWQLMIGAMMLPASLRAVEVVAGSRGGRRPIAGLAGFLVAYSLGWTAFGLLAFLGDAGVHRLVDATPWLAARPWLIQAGVLALAGAYQLLPVRWRALEHCRHPRPSTAARSGDATVGFSVGLGHVGDCLVASWALMLLMFAAGVANLAWMAVLAAVMAYEAQGGGGRRFGTAVGAVLLVLAASAPLGVGLGS